MEVNRFEVKNTIRGESAADLQFGNTAIALPASIITSTAIGYAEEMAQEYYTRIDFKQQVHEIKQRWNSKQLKQAMDSPALACESIGRINVKLDKSQAELHLYTPLLSSDVKINARVVDFFARLQFESETNTLTVLDDPRASVSETEQTFKKTKKTLEDHDDGRMKELLFLIRCDSDPQVFKEKIAVALKHTSGITAIYADPRKNPENFLTLAKLGNESVFRILSNVPRIYPTFGKAAVLPNAFLFADAVSEELGFGGKKDKEKEAKIKRKERTNAKRFDGINYGYLKIAEHKREYGEELFCGCPICEGRELGDVTAEFRNDLRKAFRTHEEHAIYGCVEDLREQIIRGNLKPFLEEKKYGKQALEDLFQIGQEKLQTW